MEPLWVVADDVDGADGAGGATPMLAVALDGAHATAGHDGGDGPGEARRAGAREIKDAAIVATRARRRRRRSRRRRQPLLTVVVVEEETSDLDRRRKEERNKMTTKKFRSKLRAPALSLSLSLSLCTPPPILILEGGTTGTAILRRPDQVRVVFRRRPAGPGHRRWAIVVRRPGQPGDHPGNARRSLGAHLLA